MTLRQLQFIAIFLLMLVAGVFWGTWFGLSRSLASISPATYLEIGHTIFRNLAGPMRILFPVALLATLGVLAGLLRQGGGNGPGGAFTLNLAGLLLFVAALIVTLLVNVPIDHQVQQWTSSTLPANWQETRDRWQWYHTIRTFAALGGLALILAGTLLFNEEQSV